MKNLLGAFTRFLAHITRDPVGMAGAVITTVSAVLFLTLFGLEIVGFHGGPYLGILSFLVLPGLFAFGLALIPVGLWLERRGARKAAERGETRRALPVFDLNDPRTRGSFLLFLGLTTLNVVILGVAGYKGIEVMDSTPFCGQTCHTVMAARVHRTTSARLTPGSRCVDCHIGPGANWFVKSKLSGSWQLVSVTFDLYPRPIPRPGAQPAPGARDLRAVPLAAEVRRRPAQGADPLRGGRGQHGDEDRARCSGSAACRAGRPRASTGTSTPPTIRYLSDEKREKIYEVEMTRRRDGQDLSARRRRRRQGHRGRRRGAPWTASTATTGRATSTGCRRTRSTSRWCEQRIDRSLPFVRREGLKALQATYADHDDARARIREAIAELLREELPGPRFGAGADAITAAAEELGTICCLQRLPEHEHRLGHLPPTTSATRTRAGCFRCHDDEHKTTGARRSRRTAPPATRCWRRRRRTRRS